MNPSPAGDIWDIFEQIIGLPSGEQEAAIDRLCHGKAALRAKVAGMLEADGCTGSFIDQPIVGDLGLQTLAAGAAQTAEARLEPGSHVGPYRVLRLLAEGGMGAVYLAARDDDSFSRHVALKVVRSGMENSQILDRLRTERSILASLSHPYIAQLYDGGSTAEGRPYFVLEYVEGATIDVYCRRNALSVDERLALFVKVCAAVQFAHQNLVIHRDLKPRNILVTPEGDPRLLDFGIAKLVSPDQVGDGPDPTDLILRIATPNYASPEQLRGTRVTTASDIYSLGVLLYKILTGHLPYRFAGMTLAEIESQLARSTPLPPSVAIRQPPEENETDPGTEADAALEPARPPKLARDLDTIVLKALRTAPDQRYSSAEQLAEDIERFRRGLPVTAHIGDWRYRGGKFLRRHRKAVATAAVLALLGCGFAVAFGLQARRVVAERDAAQLERDKKGQVLSLVVELFRLASPYVEPGQELTVREAVERSVGALGDSLSNQPAVRAELLFAAGSILSDLGVNEEARNRFTEALELQREALGDGAPNLAATISALAGSYKDLGELERAEELARQAVDLARQAGRGAAAGKSAELLASPMNELVSVLCYRSEYQSAEEPAREALALTANLPASSAPRIVSLEQLARIRDAQGDHREAVALDREAIALRRQRFGEMHPGQLGTLNNLGSSLRRSGDLAAAEKTYGEALELYRYNFGDRDTSRVLPALLNNLATVFFDRGNFDQAERLFREAQRMVARSMGEDHPLSLHLELRLARIGMRRGEPEVESRLRRLIDVWASRLGEDDSRIQEAQGILGESLSFQQRCDEAEPLLVASFDRLMELASANVRTAALGRLRDHFERCGRRAG